MGLGAGFQDAQGQWIFGELDDAGGLASDLLNLAQTRVSDGLGADRARLASLENDAVFYIQSNSAFLPSSASARRKTQAITFPQAFKTGTTPIVVVQSTVAASGTVIGAEAQSVTRTGFTLVVSVADGGTFSGSQSFQYLAHGVRV